MTTDSDAATQQSDISVLWAGGLDAATDRRLRSLGKPLPESRPVAKQRSKERKPAGTKRPEDADCEATFGLGAAGGPAPADEDR